MAPLEAEALPLRASVFTGKEEDFQVPTKHGQMKQKNGMRP